MEKIVRDKTIIIKVNDEEKKLIERTAYLNSETMSNFIRRMLMEACRKEK